MPRQTMGSEIYQYLDRFTGGIEKFIAEGTDMTYWYPGYDCLHINVVMDRRVMFGFRIEINGDMCPDPVVSIDLKKGTADLDRIVFDTLWGYLRGEDQAPHVLTLLRRMLHAQQFGLLKLTEHVIYEDGDTVTVYSAEEKYD